ncbi:hypothetical protein DYB32_001096 [Aphanomyces invadans]|uniref:Uncharacterized protein n=1 Tax=Aphanomyces invadans TaxID=157072 RepID=A0A418B7Q4_9STRA|nr:hypothetical protein DYB32_001096 [Aphanomyces invadans]
MLEYLHEHTSEGWTIMAMNEAAGYGHLACVQWLHEHKDENAALFKASDSEFDESAAASKASVLEDLFGGDDAYEEEFDETAFATELPYIPDLEFIDEDHFDRAHLDHDVVEDKVMLGPLDIAASKGRLAVVQWLHATGYPCTTYAMDSAVGNGYLETFKWLAAHRTEGCSTMAMDVAAENGHLEVSVGLWEGELKHLLL